MFAISGATVAARRQMDIFGVVVLAFATGNAGGITRDLLIGAVPPAAIANWIYLAISVLAGVIVFFRYSLIARLRHPVLLFDAIGLASFAVAGTQKALAYGLDPVMAAFMGMLTGIGGSMLRDVLANNIPVVLLRSELYAIAALACAVVVAGGHVLQLHPVAPAVTGMCLCLVLRLLAIRFNWHLPSVQRFVDNEQKQGKDGDSRDQ